MRVNLIKKDLINQIYMQLGFSKLVCENLINDFFSTIILNLKKEKKIKLSGFGTFSIRRKNSRVGRNPKTKEKFIISARKTISFIPSKKISKDLNEQTN